MFFFDKLSWMNFIVVYWIEFLPLLQVWRFLLATMEKFINHLWIFLSVVQLFSFIIFCRRLNNNKLTGPIPRELTHLKNLKIRWVYISMPFFFLFFSMISNGVVQLQFHLSANLKPRLWFCSDVSNNDLCGTIPVDDNFGSFPAERYYTNCFF